MADEVDYKGKPIFHMTHEELSAAGRVGGINSGKAKREKKKMKEVLHVLLDMPLKKGKCYDIEEIKNFASLKGKNIDVQTAILIKQVQRALAGDLTSAEFLRDTSGQKPKENVDIQANIPVVISGEDDLED